MSSEGDKKMITLRSSDSVAFEVEEAVAMESQTIRDMIQDGCAADDNGISLPNIHSKILSKVIEYCKKHVSAAAKPADSAEDLKNWDAEFIKVDVATLSDLVMAASYLNVKGFSDLTCQTMADMIKGKTLDEIRNMFNIKSNFTQEEYDIRMALLQLE